MSADYEQTNDYALKNISPSGEVPKERFSSARHAQDFSRRLAQEDTKRSKVRAMVQGIYDGNPPYNPAKLKDAGRANATNVNWNLARSYVDAGSSSFYDLSSESPGNFNIHTSYGTPEQREEYSRIMSAEADRIIFIDEDFDYDLQCSQLSMTLHGKGPMVWVSPHDILPRAVREADLKVPELSPANPGRWECCVVDVTMFPPELYERIVDEGAAAQAGWNVEATKKAISHAMGVKQPSNRDFSFEEAQRNLKNNSLAYYDSDKIVKLSWLFVKEFSGKISMYIVEREMNAYGEPEFLYVNKECYDSFNQCVAPFYLDRGNNGDHHSVTGLGTRSYSALDGLNRLLCNINDKANSPKILFKPNSAEASTKMSLAVHGDWGVIPAGTEVQQVPIQGFITDGLAMFKTSSDLLQSNLSAFKQQVPMRQSGNPVTARQISLEASQASSLSKTVIARYYRQLDVAYTEIVRRLCNLNSVDQRAVQYQKRCMDQGVPKEAFGRIDMVSAMRVVGQGNSFMRREAVGEMAAIVSRLPEDGQQAWLSDYISATVGQAAVSRYNPKPKRLASDQQAEASQWLASMRVGLVPVVTSSQDPTVYATTFIGAAGQALASLQQGANPNDVLSFLQICGPATMAHLQRIQGDPLRKPIFDQLYEQWKKLAATTDKLAAMVQKQAQAKQQQAAKTAQVMSDQEIKQFKTKSDMALKAAKQQHSMALKEATTRQNLALQDAKTASEISRTNRESEHELSLAEREAMAAAQQENLTSGE